MQQNDSLANGHGHHCEELIVRVHKHDRGRALPEDSGTPVTGGRYGAVTAHGDERSAAGQRQVSDR